MPGQIFLLDKPNSWTLIKLSVFKQNKNWNQKIKKWISNYEIFHNEWTLKVKHGAIRMCNASWITLKATFVTNDYMKVQPPEDQFYKSTFEELDVLPKSATHPIILPIDY